MRGVLQVVAKRAGHGPVEMTALEMSVDQRGGTHVGRLVDDGRQVGMRGNVAGEMVIDVKHRGACGERPVQRGAVLVHRHIQHGDPVAGAGVHFFQQVDIALDAGDQYGVARFGLAQLQQGADAVRVTVKDVVIHSITK